MSAKIWKMFRPCVDKRVRFDPHFKGMVVAHVEVKGMTFVRSEGAEHYRGWQIQNPNQMWWCGWRGSSLQDELLKDEIFVSKRAQSEPLRTVGGVFGIPFRE
jgi:hypothetical protein